MRVDVSYEHLFQSVGHVFADLEHQEPVGPWKRYRHCQVDEPGESSRDALHVPSAVIRSIPYLRVPAQQLAADRPDARTKVE